MRQRQLQPTISGPGKLNVFLHGTFAFNVNAPPPGITAYIPRLNHHVYRAGNWLAETALKPGIKGPITYHLRGVKEGGAKFNPDTNLMIKSAGTPPVVPPYAAFRFLAPKKITTLGVSEILTREFQDEDDDLLSKKDEQHVASLQIFTYDIADADQLQLEADCGEESHHWEPVFSGEYINLHIFSEEDGHSRHSNTVEDMQSIFAILGSKLVLTTPFASRENQPNDPRPDGVREEETEYLAARTRRMARLGRLFLQKGQPAQAWYPNEALDDKILACGSGVGGN